MLLLIASPISFLNNNGVVFSLRDIGASKKITDELYKHEEKYQALLSQLSIGVFRAIADKKGKLIEANKAVNSLFNIKPETNLSEHSLIDFFDDPAEGEKLLEEIIKTGSVQNRMVKFVIN